MSATWENMTAGSLLVTPEMAAACFSGYVCTLEGRGRGGIIDCDNGFFDSVAFCGGDAGGSTGGGGLGTCGGNGGCAASVLRVSGIGVIFPVPLFTVTGLGSLVCFLFVPGCVDSERVCFVPSCVIRTSSSSHVPVLRSCLVVSGIACDFIVAFSVLLVPVWGLPSGRVSVANLCKIC